MVSSETELPYNYYSLPFCKPAEGVRKSINSVNPGTILMGSRIENSPYNFSMLVNVHCCFFHAHSARLQCHTSHAPRPQGRLAHHSAGLRPHHAYPHIIASKPIESALRACRLKRRLSWHASRRDSMGLSLRGSWW